MPSTTIDNVRGVYANIEDYRTGRDASGADLPFPRTVWRLPADDTISKGMALMWTAPTETTPLEVEPMTAAIGSSDPWMFVGIALHDAVAGEDVDVCVEGICHVLMEDADAGGAVANAILVPDTTTGRAATATAGTGAVIGVQLGPEVGTTNFALCRIFSQFVRPDLDVS